MLDKFCTFALVIKKQHLDVQTGSISRLTGLEGDGDQVHLQNLAGNCNFMAEMRTLDVLKLQTSLNVSTEFGFVDEHSLI